MEVKIDIKVKGQNQMKINLKGEINITAEWKSKLNSRSKSNISQNKSQGQGEIHM